jgi:zinc protease
MSLIQEILLEPRWDEKNLNLIKQSTLNQVLQQKEIQIVSAQIEYRN